MIEIFLGFALLASAIIANKIVLASIAPALFVGIRMLAAGLILYVFFFRKSVRLSYSYLKNDLPILLSISLLTTLIPSLLKAYALKYLVSSKATFLGSFDPFVTAIYAYFLWHERLSLQKIVGMIIGFSGILILLSTTSSQENEIMVWGMLSYPELAALGAMALGRLGWILVQKVLRAQRYTVAEINGMTMILSGSGALLVALWLGETRITIIPGQELRLLGAMLWTIIIGNVIGYGMYAHFLKSHSATLISLSGFSVPIFVYIFGWLYLGESPSLTFLLASCVTFIGLLIFYQAEIKKGLLS